MNIPQRIARWESRDAALQALGFKDYRDYLRSAAWRTVKAKYRASDRPQDCFCGETEELQLHHLTYDRVGRESLDDLTPLCRRCHSMVHVLERRGLMRLDFKDFVSQARADRYKAEQRDTGATWDQVNAGRLAEREFKSVKVKLREAMRTLPRDKRQSLLDRIAETVANFEPA